MLDLKVVASGEIQPAPLRTRLELLRAQHRDRYGRWKKGDVGHASRAEYLNLGNDR